MPYKDLEKQKEWARKYYAKNEKRRKKSRKIRIYTMA